ncbi:MAG TPA: hypothetical protein V6D19_07195 [Stenomitos sp.]
MAFQELSLPIDELSLLNTMVRFAGPIMFKRQRLQGAQKRLVTIRNREVEELSNSFSEMVRDYEAQLDKDRSSFVLIVKTLYSVAKPFGYRSAWIEALLATYQKYTTQHPAPALKQPPSQQKKTS